MHAVYKILYFKVLKTLKFYYKVTDFIYLVLEVFLFAARTARAVILTTPREVTEGVRICAGREAPIKIGPT